MTTLVARTSDSNNDDSTGDVTSASFTPAADSILFAAVAFMDDGNISDNLPEDIDLTISDSEGLTWTALAENHTTGQWGGVGRVWWTQIGASPVSMTVTFEPSIGDWNWGAGGHVVFDATGANTSADPLQQVPVMEAEDKGEGNNETHTFDHPANVTVGTSILIVFSQNDAFGPYTVPTNYTALINLTAIGVHPGVFFRDDETGSAIAITDLGQLIFWTIGMAIELKPAGGLSASLFTTGDGTAVDVINEDDATSPLWSSIDDDPVTPDNTDWVNAVGV